VSVKQAPAPPSLARSEWTPRTASNRRLQDLGWWRFPAWIALALLAISTIYPVLFVAFTAFKTDAEYMVNKLGPPRDPTMANWELTVSSANLGSGVISSLIVVSASVLLLVLASTLAAHVLTKMGMSVRSSGAMMGLVVALMMMPKAVLMVPMFRMVGQVGLFNSFVGLVLVYLAMQLPAAIYLMASYYSGVPQELISAAQVDGASDLQVFWRVALPLVRPGMLVVATLNFLWLWNELMFALLLLPDASRRTLMVGLAALRGQHTTPIPNLSVALLIGIVVPLIIFVFAQRRLVEGLTQGALK
jgi:ABC-type glycerol-3-phosphate transport system permease component